MTYLNDMVEPTSRSPTTLKASCEGRSHGVRGNRYALLDSVRRKRVASPALTSLDIVMPGMMSVEIAGRRKEGST
jgi:hypothetical protein